MRTDAVCRVVIADDDPDIRALVGIAVVKAGLTLVDSAEDGTAAWHSIQLLKPDVVVLDVSMPGFTGVELCRLIRANDELGGIRILLLSAAVDDASQDIGLTAGATEYLTKPFSPRELSARLAQLVGPVGARR